MRFGLALFLASNAILLTASGPADRTITDPRSITSASNPNARPIPLDDLYFTRHVFDPAWSPDGKELAFVCDLTGRMNIWKVSSTSGWPIQMVQSDERQAGPLWSRDGRWIIYQSDLGGGEYYDLFAVPGAGGEPVNLTASPEISEEAAGFSPDGKTLAISYKPKTSANFNIALLDWGTRKIRKLTDEPEPNQLWSFGAWSPDGSKIYANRRNSGFTDSSVYQIDVATGSAANLTPHKGEAIYQVTAVAPDGKTLLITSNAKNGANNVALLDVASKQIKWVTDTTWDASSGTFPPKGESFTYVLNADGRTDVFLSDTATLRQTKLPFPDGLTFTTGQPNNFSPDGRYLLVSHESAQRPADLWTFDLETGKGKQITFSGIASLNAGAIPASQLVHYKSFDGKMISAYLWAPLNARRDASNPAIVIPHGGPTGQTVDYFNAKAAAFASRGYFVIAPNPRGSTGYGIEFQMANHQDLGGGDLKDEIAGADFLVATGYVHPKKIGITGGSYGGFMALMAIGKNPERWAAAVESYGIINWFTMLKHSDPYLQQYERSLLGDPEKDREVYEESSPLKYIRNATAPLLVLQGENDIRVPKEEADQIVDVLRKEGRTVEVHYYAGEGHGFSKRENQIDAIRRTVTWFDKYLK